MSVGPLAGLAGSVAGSPLAQTKGAEPERAGQETVAQQRVTDSEQKADAAAGIGETDGEDHEAAERDADGRRLWEPPADPKNAQQAADQTGPPPQRQSKDATGQSGNLLDLSG
jgi:hypothetical protein